MYIVLSESVSIIHSLSHGIGVPSPDFLAQALSLSHSSVFSKLFLASSGYIFILERYFDTFFFHSSPEYFRNHWFSRILTWHLVVQRHTSGPVSSYITSASPLFIMSILILSLTSLTVIPLYFPAFSFITPS